MKLSSYLKKYGPRLAAVVIAAALIVGLASSAADGSAGLLSNAAGAIGAPVQRAATAMVGWLESLYGYLYEYDTLVAENVELRSAIAELQADSRDYDEVAAENERLRELLNLSEKHSDFVYESAKIVAWDAGNYSSAFTISKGTDSGIEAGDSVITEYGALVGQVSEVGDTWATVCTVVDVGMGVGVLVGSGSYAGVLTGEYSLMQSGLTRVAYLTSGSQIFDGDEVLTSGSGGAFPAGLLIGTVTAVMTEAGGQSTYGVVEPAADLDTLSQVFVIKDFDIAE
ncbi:MAG: rod shape-determining protein MreC [Oscillospiraceae bacterium]|nr:rod shape-determining protein MreC [Oscillospiraceae bacterium]